MKRYLILLTILLSFFSVIAAENDFIVHKETNTGETIETKIRFATQVEAEAGVSGTGLMSPQRTLQTISSRFATEAEAQVGTSGTTIMTPERTVQTINARKPPIKLTVPHILASSYMGYNITASSYLNTADPWRAFNGYLMYYVNGGYTTNTSGYNGIGWLTNNTSTGWIKIELPYPLISTSVLIVGWNHDNVPSRSPKDFTLQGSNDDSTWVVLLTVTNATGWTEPTNYSNYYTFSNTVAYKYYKVDITANMGDSGYVGLRQIELY